MQGKLAPAQESLCQPTMPVEELYDLEADPYEICNLAGSTRPEYQAALARLGGVVEKWIEETNDQGRVYEPSEVVAAQGATKADAKLRPGPKGPKKGKQQP